MWSRGRGQGFRAAATGLPLDGPCGPLPRLLFVIASSPAASAHRGTLEGCITFIKVVPDRCASHPRQQPADVVLQRGPGPLRLHILQTAQQEPPEPQILIRSPRTASPPRFGVPRKPVANRAATCAVPVARAAPRTVRARSCGPAFVPTRTALSAGTPRSPPRPPDSGVVRDDRSCTSRLSNPYKTAAGLPGTQNNCSWRRIQR